MQMLYSMEPKHRTPSVFYPLLSQDIVEVRCSTYLSLSVSYSSSDEQQNDSIDLFLYSIVYFCTNHLNRHSAISVCFRSMVLF